MSGGHAGRGSWCFESRNGMMSDSTLEKACLMLVYRASLLAETRDVEVVRAALVRASLASLTKA